MLAPELTKKRRGRGKGKHKTNSLKVMYNNINGFPSKKESLFKIVDSVDPDILALCETKKSRGIKKDELSSYEVVENPLKLGKEGLMVCVKKDSFNSIKEVTDTELKHILTVRIVYPCMNIRVIVCHAPQETDPLEKRLEFFEELSVQVERCLTSGDEMLLMGDLNSRIFEGEFNVEPTDGSPNGKQLSELVQKYNLKVANFHQNCSGRLTRIQARKDGTTKESVLDYILLQQRMYQKLTKMVIDEEKIFCPYRVTSTKGKRSIVYSDHCVLIADLEVDVGQATKTSCKSRGWKFSDEGFEQYRIESEPALEFEPDELSATKLYDSWVVSFEKLLAKCFSMRTYNAKGSKVKVHSKKHKQIRMILSVISKKGRIQREIVKWYLLKVVEFESYQMADARAKKIRETTAKLTVRERFSPVGYWKMKKAADKGTRKEQALSSIILGNGVEVDGEKAIIEAYKEEFERRLANRKPEKGWEEYTEETNFAVREWLKGVSESSPPFSDKEMDSVLASLKEDCSPGMDKYPPKLFTKAGAGVVKSMLLLLNRIKELKDIPEQWNLVKIVTIYKKKGSKKELKFYRGIFLTIVISKIFEKLIKARIEEHLKQINLLQAGSRHCRSEWDIDFFWS